MASNERKRHFADKREAERDQPVTKLRRSPLRFPDNPAPFSTGFPRPDKESTQLALTNREPIIEFPEEDKRPLIKFGTSKQSDLVSLQGGAGRLTISDKNLIKQALVCCGITVYKPNPRALYLTTTNFFLLKAVEEFRRYLKRNRLAVPSSYDALRAKAITHRRRKLEELAYSKYCAETRLVLAANKQKRPKTLAERIGEIIPEELIASSSSSQQAQAFLGLFSSLLSNTQTQASAPPEVLEAILGIHQQAEATIHHQEDIRDVAAALYKHFDGKNLGNK